MINNIRYFFEKRGFKVSSRIGDRLGIKATRIRLFFIYISFFTLGLAFAFYLTLAFLAKIKDLVYTKRSSVFDL
ncbi:PspC domain-containing protein [Myroides injenensis]|uniref:PspC domain-containing protein n=1 Tax=Myroides injenensis TaxID=1183151 RepID=UPI00227075E3|nr:PspC domain-containing protein [Myroides injenensis]